MTQQPFPAGQTLIVDPVIEAYVEAVGRRLTDLPPDDRVELLDELRQHATALLTETPLADLVERLGTPATYAAELRDAAGLPDTDSLESWRARVAGWEHGSVGRSIDQFVRWPLLRRAARDLTPAWWFARGLIIGLVLLAVVTRGTLVGPGGASQVLQQWFSERPHLGLMGAVVCGLASVWIGYATHDWSSRTPARKVLLVLLNIGIALFGWATLSAAMQSSYDTSGSAGAFTPIGLSMDGNPVTNVLAYDSAGKPVQVQLFNSDGTPLTLQSTFAGEGNAPFSPDGSPATGIAVPAYDSSGRMVANVFPQQAIWMDDGNSVLGSADSRPLLATPFTQQPQPTVGTTISLNADGTAVAR